MKKEILYILLFLLSSITLAQIKYVPTDYAMIQHAINYSKDGDIIIVEEGIYAQQINFKGKAITVASEFYLDGDTSHISKTIIDGMFLKAENDSSSLVYFVNGEDSTSELLGFTLQNGKGTYNVNDRENWRGGGAVFIEKSGATISNNIIRYNEAIIPSEIINYYKELGSGGGINIRELPNDRSVIIKDNLITNNGATGTIAFGGGISVYWNYGNVSIYRNELIKNKARAKDSGYGGGIAISAVDNKSQIKIENNFISNNSTYSYCGSSKGGGIACYFAAPIIRNNIIVLNATEYPSEFSKNAFGGGIAVHWYANATKKYQICDPKNLSFIIDNNTIAYNNDKHEGGGVAIRSVGGRLKNNIIGCNFAQKNKQIKVENPDLIGSFAPKVWVEYCNIEGGYDGWCNINKFPEFVDEEHWFLKRDLSPCVDAGDPSKEFEDIPDPTQIGKAFFPALGSRRNDMGAFGGPHSKWQDLVNPTGVKKTGNKLPNRIYLSQNYPNPFNPTTTIKYSIPSNEKRQTSNVKMIVYDMLGKEIATLVNENHNSGNYEIAWDGSDYPSGVYLYKLTTGDFASARKMLLIK